MCVCAHELTQYLYSQTFVTSSITCASAYVLTLTKPFPACVYLLLETFHARVYITLHMSIYSINLFPSSPLLLTLSNPLTTGAPILDGTVPLALRLSGGDGRGLGFIRSLDTRSTLMETGNLRFALMAGEDCWVRYSPLGLVEQRRAVRMAFTAT